VLLGGGTKKRSSTGCADWNPPEIDLAAASWTYSIHFAVQATASDQSLGCWFEVAKLHGAHKFEAAGLRLPPAGDQSSKAGFA